MSMLRANKGLYSGSATGGGAGAGGAYACTKCIPVFSVVCNIFCSIPLTLSFAIWGTVVVWKDSGGDDLTNSETCQMGDMKLYVMAIVFFHWTYFTVLFLMTFLGCVGFLIPFVCDFVVICFQIILFIMSIGFCAVSCIALGYLNSCTMGEENSPYEKTKFEYIKPYTIVNFIIGLIGMFFMGLPLLLIVLVICLICVLLPFVISVGGLVLVCFISYKYRDEMEDLAEKIEEVMEARKKSEDEEVEEDSSDNESEDDENEKDGSDDEDEDDHDEKSEEDDDEEEESEKEEEESEDYSTDPSD